MKDIKIEEVRQALEQITNNGVFEVDDYKTLDQFITDAEELYNKTTICGLSLDEAIPVIQMYKALKDTTHQLRIDDLMMGTKSQFYPNGVNSVEELTKENKELKEAYDFQNEMLKNKTLHNSQAIEPSVLEKIDKLENLTQNQKMHIKAIERILEQWDKALDKACLYLSSIDRPKISEEQWKEDLLKESEKQQ